MDFLSNLNSVLTVIIAVLTIITLSSGIFATVRQFKEKKEQNKPDLHVGARGEEFLRRRKQKSRRRWIVFLLSAVCLVAMLALSLLILPAFLPRISWYSSTPTDGDSISVIAWAPKGTTIAYGNREGTIQVWDSAAQRTIVTLSAPDQNISVDALAWSTSGNQIAAAIGGVVKVWDVASGQPVQTYHEFAGGVHSFAWSPDGTRMAFAGGEMVKVVNDRSPGDALMFGGLAGTIQTLAWSPDGTRIATADDNGVQIWDAGTGKELCSLQNSGVLSVSWSLDGKRIATAGSDPEVEIWRVAPCTTEPINVYPGPHHRTIITSAAWSPNGKEVASVDNAGTLSVWDPNTMSDLVKPYADTAIDPGYSSFELTSVAWSHDGSLIAFIHDEVERSGYSSSRVVIVSIS